MEVREWTYEEFPPFRDFPEEAHHISSTGDETGTYYLPDVKYAQMDGIPLYLQILMPLSRNHPAQQCPCVVYVQGSGWMPQDCYHNVGRIARLADRGYVVAIVQYRHSGQAGFPAPIQDARNAVRFMRKNAREYHVIPDEIFIGGSSSGGHTAVFAAIAGKEEHPFFDRSQYRGVSAEVCGVLDYYGCVSLQREDDFPSMTDRESPEGMYQMYLSHVPEERRHDLPQRATAVNYITKELTLPPFWIIHGTKDRIVNTRASVELYRTLRKCGKNATLTFLDGADHGGPDFWSKEVVDSADLFMRSCLKEQKSAANSTAQMPGEEEGAESLAKNGIFLD